MDIYRCYELWQIVGESAKCSTGALIEIGVWKGGTGALIAYKAFLDKIPQHVYLCDTFTGVVKASKEDSRYKGGEYADSSEAIVKLLMDNFKLENVKILTGVFPEETSHIVKNETFRFCHIDVDVFNSARDIMLWIWDRLEVGGIIVFDDYGFGQCDGITKYVDSISSAEDRIFIYNINGHAILIKIKNKC